MAWAGLVLVVRQQSGEKGPGFCKLVKSRIERASADGENMADTLEADGMRQAVAGGAGRRRVGTGSPIYDFRAENRVKRARLNAMASWLRANADPKYLLGFILGINLGLRANELLELKCSDIFFPDGRIRCNSDDYSDTTDRISVFQEKVDKRRGLYLNASCVHAIQWYYGDKGNHYSDKYVFASREGGHIEVDTLRKVLKRAAKACGIKQNIGTHTLRKTFGYFHYQSNHDIVFLQRLFGHSSALVTMRYIGIADEEEKKAYHEVSIDLLSDI